MNKSLYSLIILLFIFTTINGFYENDKNVIELTSDNFQDLVVKSKDPWLIEFFAPWCGHCKNLAPEWKKAAKALKGMCKVGAVNMDEHKNIGAPYNIQGFPTLKFFGDNKSSPADYSGARTADGIVDYVLSQLKDIAKSRLKGKKTKDQDKPKKDKQQNNSGGDSDKDVVVLTDSNFDSLVDGSEDIWLIEFYAPWCGHCKKLEPEWNAAAKELKGIAKFGKVDATEETNLGQRYSIQGYPTIKCFLPGGSIYEPMDYNAGRTKNDIINWINGLTQEPVAPKKAAELLELTAQDVFDENCVGSKGICILAFLPHILDSSASQRNQYLELIKNGMAKHKAKPASFFWAQAGDQLQTEGLFNLGFGYPAVVGISPSKLKYLVQRQSFTERNFNSFVEGFFLGKISLFDLKTLPRINSVQPWDGQDASLDLDDDFDLYLDDNETDDL